MSDPRYQELADVLVNFSTKVKPGENLLLEAIDVPPAFVEAMIAACTAAGARPFLQLRDQQLWRALLHDASKEQLQLQAKVDAELMSNMDAYVGVRGSNNVSEWSDVPKERIQLYEELYAKPVHFDLRVPKTKWCILRWPTSAMAQLAQMSTRAFEDFYFKVCTLDYSRMANAIEPLRERMNQTDQVRLVSPGTDLRFSIKDIPAIPCAGEMNIPDGEIFTAPVRDSVQGTIQFNTPTIYQGVSHQDIHLEFEDGQVIAARSNNSEHLNQVLDTDSGGRYVGEFAIGFNPHIQTPMKDILFDEKIAGSIHFTPGQAYEEADNGNRSKIHWDMVLLMDEAAGGGEIWFDDVLIRKNGRFVEGQGLDALNPENLV